MAEQKEIVEREYIIPLRREWINVPQYRRAPKAIKAIKKFIARHMRIPDRDLDKVKINKWVNQEVWFRGIKKPMSKIKVKAIRKDDLILVELAEIPEKVKFMIEREKKREEKSKKKVDKKKEEKIVKEEKIEEVSEELKEEKREEKVKEKEKEEAVREAGKELAKQEARTMKHTSKDKKVIAHRMALKK